MEPTPTLVCAGPILVDVIERAGAERACPGGNAVIVSAVAARLGLHVRLVGQLGDDAAGAEVRALLAAHGVDCAGLRALPHTPTKTAHLRVDPDGTWRWLRSTPRAFPYLGPDQVPALDPRAAHLHLAGLPPLLRAAPDATAALIARWRHAGAALSLGLARFDDDERDRLDPVIASPDLVFGTAAELARLAGRPTPTLADAPAALQRARLTRCVATFGPDGAVARWDRATTHAPAPTRRARSTVGAGDTFSAAFLAAWLQRRPPADALRCANAAAAASVEGATWWEWLEDLTGLDALEARARAQA